MPSHAPQGDPAGQRDSRRVSSSGAPNFRASTGGSGLPRPQTSLRDSRIGGFRASSIQPSYNFLTGEGNAQPGAMNWSTSRQSLRGGPSPPGGRPGTAATNFSRESSKENVAPPDAEEYETQRRRIEELKAEVGDLKYKISNHEQERELDRLRAEQDVRDATRRADNDFQAKQDAETERNLAKRQIETLKAELEELAAEKESQKRELEAKARDAAEEARVLQDQLEDLNVAKEDAAKMAQREVVELNNKLTTAQRAQQELEEESRTREEILENTQAALAQRDETIGQLEADVLRLKATTGDAETIAVIRRELTDQVAHIRRLEATNRDQLVELKHLRQIHRAVEIVEEEKRSLQRQLEAAESVEVELAEERHQRQRLEDERRAWTAYLEGEAGVSAEEFDSPEAVVRALIKERLNSAALTEKLGGLQPELTARENIITSLESENTTLKREIEKLKKAAPSAGNDKARARIERQRALAIQEVDYLRTQLKTFDAEDMTVNPEIFDEEKSKRIHELEDLVDKYRAELQTITQELNSLESASKSPSAQPLLSAGSKRSRENEDSAGAESEQLGQLARKNRKLQDELSEVQAAHRLLQKEHAVKAEQLASAQEQLKTRILSLRSNPTSDHESVKTATLAALKLENAELLAHIERKPTLFATIPASQLAAARREIEAAQAETASARKSMQRLKEVWAAKSGEFKEAVFSTMGWTVTFMPGGKMRIESVYCPSKTDEHENSIVFDGERGTMKVGGGPNSAFAQRISNNIQFWVRDRGCVPCFLAALTLEFYDAQHTGTNTKGVGLLS